MVVVVVVVVNIMPHHLNLRLLKTGHKITFLTNCITAAIKSICWSQVTGLLDLMKGHSDHKSQMELTNPFFDH